MVALIASESDTYHQRDLKFHGKISQIGISHDNIRFLENRVRPGVIKEFFSDNL